MVHNFKITKNSLHTFFVQYPRSRGDFGLIAQTRIKQKTAQVKKLWRNFKIVYFVLIKL